jgi:hypothetical protein
MARQEGRGSGQAGRELLLLAKRLEQALAEVSLAPEEQEVADTARLRLATTGSVRSADPPADQRPPDLVGAPDDDREGRHDSELAG